MKSSFGRFVAAVAAGVAGFAVTASAATTTYTGAGANSNWSTAANWNPAAPANGDALVLSATAGARKTMNNDSLSTAASLEFTTAGNTLNGNLLSIDNGGFIKSNTGIQTINIGLLANALDVNTVVGSSGFRIEGRLSGAGTINKVGPGSLELNGSNTYNGQLNVNGGTLLGSGISPTLNVNVVTGTITPGPAGSIGAMETGSLVLGSGAKSVMQIDDLANFDQIDVNGALTYGGDLNMAFNDASLLPSFSTWSLYDFTVAQSGEFANVNWTASNSPYSGLSFSKDPITNLWTSGTFTGFGGQDQFFVFENSTGNLVLVPEPSTMVFAAIGLVVSGAHVMRKRRKAAAVIAG